MSAAVQDGAPLVVAILSVGDELVSGELVDTNAPWIARAVRAAGHDVVGFATVPDRIEVVARAVVDARRDADLLLVTGGLGPTADDLTRDGVAAALDLDLIEDAGIRADLESLHRGRTPNPGSARQALIPRGGEVLANPLGTAPGFLLVEGGLRLACVPGVPSEMRPMIEALLQLPWAAGRRAATTRKLLVCGLPESEVGQRLADLMDMTSSGVRVGVTTHHGVHTVAIRGRDEDALDAVCARAAERLGDAVAGIGNRSLAEIVVSLARASGMTLAAAESCTGGLLAGAITEVPGSSQVFLEAAVTYCSLAKIERLGVPASTLEQHGAVSVETARAMAQGERERSGADLCVSVTGIAGPDGGSPDKPVGLVVFGLAHEHGVDTLERRWRGSREEIRGRSVNTGLELLRRRLAATQSPSSIST